MTRNRYGTTNPVLIEARINHDPYDEFAWVQDWRFAICDYLWWFEGVPVPVPGFRPDEPEDTFELAMIRNLYDNSNGGVRAREECLYALKILDRYREWLRIAGEDYY